MDIGQKVWVSPNTKDRTYAGMVGIFLGLYTSDTEFARVRFENEVIHLVHVRSLWFYS
jgi:hypothetical protein